MIALGADHGGYKLKEEIKRYFDESGIKYIDFGHVIVSLAVSSVSYGAVYFGILLALRESFAVQCLGMARAMLNKIRR